MKHEAKRTIRFLIHATTAAALSLGVAAASAADFGDPVNCSSDLRGDPAPADAGFRMSRNPARQMAGGGDGVLHMTFWFGPAYTSPSDPSGILHRTWTPEGGFGAATRVDNSVTEATGEPIGGRNPSMLLAANGDVWIAWHDYRHCTGAPGNWINNVEVYLDVRPARGVFSDEDIRLTRTGTPGTGGDNGYAPRLIERASGAVGVAWYDFHYSDVADLFYAETDENGDFTSGAAMGDWRLTDYQDRGGDEATPYVFPDLMTDADDTVHLVWAASNYSAAGDLMAGRLGAGGALEGEATLETNAASFMAPPRLFASPAGDELWALWSGPPLGTSRIHLHRWTEDGGWEDGVVVPLSGAQTDACGAVGPDGAVHLAYTAGASIRYARYDPSEDEVVEDIEVAGADYVDIKPFPSIHIDGEGGVYVLWSEKSESDGDDLTYSGDVFLAYAPPAGPEPTPEPAGPASVWIVY